MSFATFSCSDKFDKTTTVSATHKTTGSSQLTDGGHVGTATALAHSNAVLALVRTIHHHTTPPGLRVPATFARHGELATFAFNFGGKDKTFARKIAAHSAYTVSHGDDHGEDGGGKTRTKEGGRWRYLKQEGLGLSGRKTLRRGIVSRTNHKGGLCGAGRASQARAVAVAI